MKKIAVALTIMMLTFAAQANQTIQIVWAFGISDSQVQYIRNLIEELNQNQKKYNFILENRPGAGGTIGAKYVATTPNTILSTSTAFFVRPNFYPDDSHRVDDFRPLMTQCASPMLVVSHKYKSWNNIDKKQSITIGISGLGATSHLIAMQIKKQFPNVRVVPYKGAREAIVDVINENLDMSLAFLSEVEGFINVGKLNALGLTGTHSLNNIPTLKSQGFDLEETVLMLGLKVPITMPQTQYNELRSMVVKASESPKVQQSYKDNYCKPSNLNLQETNAWFIKQAAMWKRLSQGVNINEN
jgi:tripartite-type tricarboxylate transporter receptor subunit TctC